MSTDVSRTRAKPLRLTSPEPERAPNPQTDNTPPVDIAPVPSSIAPRVLAALEQPPTHHADFIASDRTAEVRLTDADWRNVCSDCHGRLSRERVGSDTYLSCATCNKRGLLQKSPRGGEYIRWRALNRIEKGPTE